MGDNGKKEEVKLDCVIKIGMSKDGEFMCETNVPTLIVGYGMLEFAKRGIERHILKLQQKSIIPGKQGIMNFVRGMKK